MASQSSPKFFDIYDLKEELGKYVSIFPVLLNFSCFTVFW